VTVAVTAADLARRLAASCPPRGIDLAGAAVLDGPDPDAEHWHAWLDRDLHGNLDYLVRTRDERADARARNPWARSLLVFAQRYTDGWPAADDATGDWLGSVSRYARGADYHDVLLAAVKAVLRDLGKVWPELRAHPAVDTGPYLERAWAARAGLGFIGKNACLIHETLGSGLFLAVAPTNLILTDLDAAPHPLYQVADRGPVPRAETDRCGSCTRCLDACPTDAFVAPRILDAGRCLSTWSIEWQGRAPADSREQQGDRLFGCDVCQQVCPWNGKALRGVPQRSSRSDAYSALASHVEVDLAALLRLDAEAFRQRFRRTPIWRAHPEGLRRNALVVAADTGRTDLLEEIRRLAHDDPDPETRDVAAWAATRLEENA